MKLLQFLLLLAAAMPATSATQPFYDRKHFSKVLGEERNYRILLPPDYESSGRRYPVIYYYCGAGRRDPR
jgi:predicted alpha/beta superfamily hydrolase